MQKQFRGRKNVFRLVSEPELKMGEYQTSLVILLNFASFCVPLLIIALTMEYGGVNPFDVSTDAVMLLTWNIPV